MQLLSQVLAAPPAGPRYHEFFQREEIQDLAGWLLVFIVGSQLIAIAGNWLASRALVDRDRATLGRAAALWLCYLVFGFFLIIGLGILLPVLAALREGWRVLLVGGGAAALALLLVFLFPMKIYAIGFFRAFGLILLASLIAGVAAFGVQFAAAKAFGLEARLAALEQIGGTNAAERSAFYARVNGRNAPDEIDYLLDEALHPIGPRPPLAQRERDVLLLQQKLQTRRNALSTTTPAPVAHFQRQFNRYLQLLNQVKAERSAQAANPAH